jgi:hypothetical protein
MEILLPLTIGLLVSVSALLTARYQVARCGLVRARRERPPRW